MLLAAAAKRDELGGAAFILDERHQSVTPVWPHIPVNAMASHWLYVMERCCARAQALVRCRPDVKGAAMSVRRRVRARDQREHCLCSVG